LKTARTEQAGGSGEQQDIIYGLHALREALRSGSGRLLRLYVARQDRQYADIVQLARCQHIPVYLEARESLNRFVPHRHHQGIVGFVAAKSYASEEDILDYATHQPIPPLLVVLDGIEDPQNLGAVLRTAEAAGVHGVFIPERRAVGLTAGVARASAGAIEYVRVARTTNIGGLINRLQEQDITACALDLHAPVAYTSLDFRGPMALVFGKEGKGIRPGVAGKCRARAAIPMFGHIQSLNLSTTVGIVLFEMIRQRQAGEEKQKRST